MRAWLVLAVIVVLGADASADHPRNQPTVCASREGILLPHNGDTGVPLNARLWHLYRGMELGREPLGDLKPFTTYDLPWPHTGFTTGDAIDHQPPLKPQIGALWMTVGNASAQGRAEVGTLRISGTVSMDTAVLRLRLRDAVGTVVYEMPRDQLWIAEPGFSIAAGPVDVEIVAIDLAGNESAPAHVDGSAIFDPAYRSTCGEWPSPGEAVVGQADEQPHEDPGLIANASIMIPFVLELIVLVGGGIAMNRARRRRMMSPITGLLPAAAEQLARRRRLRSALLVVALVIDIPAVVRLGPNAEIVVKTLVPLLIMVFAGAVTAWFTSWQALRLLAQNGATAAVRYDAVIVITPAKRVAFVSRLAAIHRAQLPSVDLQ